MKEFKSKIKKKSSLVAIVAFIVIIFCVFANASGLSYQITNLITSKISSAFNRQDYLEINRDNTPKINVSIDSSNESATVEITNFPSGATSKQYRLDGSVEDWKDYTGEFTIKENTIIQTRYKKSGDENYTIGSSKVIVDLNYNIALQKPTITLKQGDAILQQTEVANSNVTVNLSTTDEADKTVFYELTITRYPLNQLGLINSDGTINIQKVKNEGNNETTYTKNINGNSLELSESGVYKIIVISKTHSGFVKSSEVIGVTAIDKVTRVGLFNFKTADGKTYDVASAPWTDQNVIVTLNKDNDIAFGNNNITYSLSGATIKAEGPISNQVKSSGGVIETITNEGTTTVTLNIKIGVITLSEEYDVKIDKTAPNAPTITVTSGTLSNGWYTNDVTLRITGGMDSGSGMKDVSYTISGASTVAETRINSGNTFKISNEGIHTITAYTYDNLGYKSVAATQTIKIDKTAPNAPTINVTSGTLSGEWYTTDVTLKVTGGADSISGMKNVSYTISGASTVSETRINSGNTFKISNEGTHTITAYTYDNAGNKSVSSVKTIKIDKKAPNAPSVIVTSGTAGEHGWYKSGVTLKITGGNDNLSGINNVSYSISGSSTVSEKEINSGSTFNIGTEGIHHVKAYTYDKAGLKSVACELDVKIDWTPPTIVSKSINQKKVNNQSAATIKIRATDSNSGVWKVCNDISGYDWIYSSSSSWTRMECFDPPVADTGTVNTYSYTPGYHYVRAMDYAGNVTSVAGWTLYKK